MSARREVARAPSNGPAPQPLTLSDETMQRMLALQEQRLQLELKQADTVRPRELGSISVSQ